jgi:hypothetical protein
MGKVNGRHRGVQSADDDRSESGIGAKQTDKSPDQQGDHGNEHQSDDGVPQEQADERPDHGEDRDHTPGLGYRFRIDDDRVPIEYAVQFAQQDDLVFPVVVKACSSVRVSRNPVS